MNALSVCSPVRVFADDVVDHCCECGREVFIRPHTALLPLQRLCSLCYLTRRAAGEEFEIRITPDTARELSEYLATSRPKGSA